MRFWVLRKRRFWEKRKREKVVLEDVEIEIAYVSRVSKRVKRLAKGFDRVVSLDFKEFFIKSELLFLLAERAYEKIASRHGGVDREVLEFQVDILNEEIIEKLTAFALGVRRVIIHSGFAPVYFDFLCDEAGVCPEFAQGDYRQNMVVVFGEEFLIKHIPSGKIYYDIFPQGIKIPEINMIFSEYLRQNPQKISDVKIRDLMSK